MKKEEDPKEILIFKGEQIWQTQLSKLSPEKRKKINEDIHNSPQLIEAMRTLRENKLKKNENK